MSGEPRLRRLRHRGYNLVALIVALVVMNIALAAVMPLWSKAIRRAEEEELIFRGLQYAEAIRVFRARFNRPPTRLDELLELKPRSIRQLWIEPISDSGRWRPILAGSGTDLTGVTPDDEAGEGSGEALSEALDGRAATGAGSPTPSGRAPSFSSGDGDRATGPIEGVAPTAQGESIKSFLGKTTYRSWEFRAQLLMTPQVTPEGVPLSPRIDPSALGRPFPDHLRATPGSAPHAPLDDEDSPEGEEDGSEFGDG